MATTYTLISWVVIFGLAGLVIYRNYCQPSQTRQAILPRGVTKGSEKKKEPKKVRKVNRDAVQNSVVQKGQQKPQPEYKLIAIDVDRDDEDLNNKEFARQLSSAKNGTLMPSKSQAGAKQRSIKQNKAQERPVETSSDNGTTGADADDDRSSINSPELGATSMPAHEGDVSDMLEPRAAGPSVLRVTAPTKPTTIKKAKATTAAEVIETKKQRQNRHKAELKKQIRDEEEKERKVLLEKQLRTAREAEGRPPKDGSVFMASQAPASSVWTGPTKTNADVNKTTEPAKLDFLDTYTPKASASQSESELAGSDWQKVATNISEEEQVRRAIEDSDSWKTVGKDKRKKKAQPAQTSQLTESTQSSKPESDDDDVSDYAPPALVGFAGSKPGQVWGMKLVTKVGEDQYEEYEKDVADSEWEVA